MLSNQPAEIVTPRLKLTPLRVSHAAAFWPILCEPALYQWIPRGPPQALVDVAARFQRIQTPCARRAEQWLNWTVWTREAEALGVVEATVAASNAVQIAYMFDVRQWGRGYAHEALDAALTAMRADGAVAFEATIDTNNTRSLALVQRLGFLCVETRSADDMPGSEESVWLLKVDQR